MNAHGTVFINMSSFSSGLNSGLNHSPFAKAKKQTLVQKNNASHE